MGLYTLTLKAYLWILYKISANSVLLNDTEFYTLSFKVINNPNFIFWLFEINNPTITYIFMKDPFVIINELIHFFK